MSSARAPIRTIVRSLELFPRSYTLEIESGSRAVGFSKNSPFPNPQLFDERITRIYVFSFIFEEKK